MGSLELPKEALASSLTIWLNSPSPVCKFLEMPPASLPSGKPKVKVAAKTTGLFRINPYFILKSASPMVLIASPALKTSPFTEDTKLFIYDRLTTGT